MRVNVLPMMLLFAVCLTGCGNAHFDTISDYIVVRDGSVVVRAPSGGEADITANGDLTIAGNNVVVTDPQRQLLKQYYTTVLAIREHGIATGKAGVAIAAKAISSVASGVANGNMDKVDSEVNASAAKVEAQAANICSDLAQIYTLQEALSAQLEAFRPYAVVKESQANDCQKKVKDHSKS